MSEPSWRTVLDVYLTREHGEAAARMFGSEPGFREAVVAAYALGEGRAVRGLVASKLAELGRYQWDQAAAKGLARELSRQAHLEDVFRAFADDPFGERERSK